MELKIKNGIDINGVNLKTRKIRIENGVAKIYADYTEIPIKDISNLSDGDFQIIKDGKVALTCNNDCMRCPMCEDYRFEIYSKPLSYSIEWGYKCAKKSRYSETLEDLPNSRIKYASDIELKKAYEKIKAKFYRKSRNTVTKQTIKEIIEHIDDALIPNMAENWDEYGHSRIELNLLEVSKNKFGYQLYYSGRMGDYGLGCTDILIHKNCDIQELKDALRKRYYKKYRTEIRDRT